MSSRSSSPINAVTSGTHFSRCPPTPYNFPFGGDGGDDLGAPRCGEDQVVHPDVELELLFPVNVLRGRGVPTNRQLPPNPRRETREPRQQGTEVPVDPPRVLRERDVRHRVPSVLHVPAIEVVLELLLPAVEVPPGPRILMSEVGEGLEVLHALRSDVGELLLQGCLLEGILPDRAARKEAGGPAAAGEVDELVEDAEIRPRAEDDPGNLRDLTQPLAVPS